MTEDNINADLEKTGQVDFPASDKQPTDLAPSSGSDATMIRDADATSMGDLPDMELLALGARFAIMSRQDHGKEYFISKKEMVAGRAQDCELKMDYPGVSRKHFKVLYKNKGITIEDLGSKFGLLIDGKKVEGTAHLKSGNSIQLGEVTLKYLEGNATLSSAGGPSKIIAGIACVVVLILLSVLLLKKLNTDTSYSALSPQNATTTHSESVDADIAKIMGAATNLATIGNHEQALLQLDLVFEKDPGNLQALGLQKMWREKLSLQQKIKQAKDYFQSKSMDQARLLTQDILQTSPENVEAQDLQKQIEAVALLQKQQDTLKEVKKLIADGKLDLAKKTLSSIQDPSSQTEIEALHKEIQDQEHSNELYKVATDLFEKGDLEACLPQTREGLANAPDHAALKKLEAKIEAVQKLGKVVSKAFSESSPMQAREPLKQILELVGETNPLGKDVRKKLNELQSKAQVLGQLAYQEALGFLADGHLKEAMLRLDHLAKDFPEETAYLDARNELCVRLDNLGKAMFRAGYVLEEKDTLKAKEIWQRLLTYLPDDHPYARKAQAKIDGK